MDRYTVISLGDFFYLSTDQGSQRQEKKKTSNVHYNVLLNRWHHGGLKDLTYSEKFPTYT